MDAFEVRVKLFPLLSRNIEVKRFVMKGPKIVLEKGKDGRGAVRRPLGRAREGKSFRPFFMEPFQRKTLQNRYEAVSDRTRSTVGKIITHGGAAMTENQPNRDPTMHRQQREHVLQNTRDPLPWLIGNLRQKRQDESDSGCGVNEPRQEGP